MYGSKIVLYNEKVNEHKIFKFYSWMWYPWLFKILWLISIACLIFSLGWGTALIVEAIRSGQGIISIGLKKTLIGFSILILGFIGSIGIPFFNRWLALYNNNLKRQILFWYLLGYKPTSENKSKMMIVQLLGIPLFDEKDLGLMRKFKNKKS